MTSEWMAAALMREWEVQSLPRSKERTSETVDPNANLAEQLRLAKSFLDSDSLPEDVDVVRLAELVVALDQWIRSGGFLPHPWKTPPRGDE